MENFYSKRLIELVERDLNTRNKILKDKEFEGKYHPEMEKVHRENAEELRKIIDEIGFPTVSKVGKEASNAAWLIIQHSISEPQFMKSCYELMLKNDFDVDRKNLAYLYDRIQYFQGLPQKFGTQLNADQTIFPVINKNKINEFRQEFNLPNLTLVQINSILSIEEIEKIESQNQDYIIWRKKIGWK
ncbi:hypothetical protein NZ698_03910 [Chryseobacterium sp. PBS4-4]|uniref:Uncharacterized protein n=1 Tax=Chryseobacterium edaphi TaxID=2976532 RepID=A0ABT2W274_9FLAO|nr:DUF6624 domain-containing protein [Chryseobacterium edaphi]MCU7616330.1 hypothetical protein [Chryseobacterium edaphi]